MNMRLLGRRIPNMNLSAVRILQAMRLPAVAGMALAAAVASVAGGVIEPFETDRSPQPATRIDAMVLGRLRKAGIEPAPLCSDAVFVRRAWLDVTGTLPTADEARSFIADPAPDKRARLIDHLLSRAEYVDYWTLKWADALRVKAEFPIRLWPKAAEAYYRWIGDAVAENRPYDRMVREMLLATGSNFYDPSVNFYRAMQSRAPEDIARTVALTFFGVRPEAWPSERWAQMSVFFSRIRYKGTSEWKEEIVYLDPQATDPLDAVLPDGVRARIAAGADARAVFANWLISERNPWFARHMANRMWYWIMGRGIVHEPDDVRPDNPPAIPELLDYLAGELVSSGWNLKRLQRLILTSEVYQMSSIPRSSDKRADVLFARYAPRRLEAEVLIDAICQITGTTERYVSPVPEPFTYMPEEMRTIELPDGNSTSAFLELFGRPARDTGLMSERNNATSASQRLHLLNSRHIHEKIVNSRKLQRILSQVKRPEEAVTELYWTVLSRPPTSEELKRGAAHGAATGARPRDTLVDVVWALINSEEFLHRH